MGDAADDLRHLEWCQSMPRSEVNPHGYRTDPEWTTRDGKKIKLSKMTTEHIKNCIKLMERTDTPEAKHNVRLLQEELDGRSSST